MFSPAIRKLLRYFSLGFLFLVTLGLSACGGSSSSSSAVATPSTYYVVTNTNDSGSGSLRDAITAVNNSSTSQYSGISFAVGGTITLLSDLPVIAKKVLIDGGTSPGYVAGNTTTAPLVAVNFNGVASGFNFGTGSAGSGIYALSIYGSNSNGVSLNSGSSSIILLRNYIGLKLNGTAGGNAGHGIYISATSINNVIGSNPNSISGLYSNVISGNTLSGINIDGSAGNRIQANAIGTNPAGTAAIPNLNHGIWVTYYATENTIGGTAFYDSATGQTNNPTGNKGTVPIVSIAPPLGNLISGNAQNGVLIDRYSELTVLSGNFVGTNNVGTSAVGNGWNGVAITNANNNQLIGCTFEDNPFIYYNVLSGNGRNGLYIYNSNAVLVQANFFGIGANNASIVRNALNGILVGGTSAGVQVGGVIPLGNVSAGNGVSGSGVGDGIRLEDTVTGFTTFNTFAGLYAFQGAAPNQGNGITVDSSGANNLIRTNVSSGNIGHGIELTVRATGVTVDPNVVGLNTEGTAVLTPGSFGNGGSGIKVSGSNNIIGGYNNSVIPQNTFSGNARYGIEIAAGATGNYVFNASIGLATTFVAGTGFGNGLGGMLIAGTGNFVEPYNATPSTYTGVLIPAYISGNAGPGITVVSGNTVTGNYFGYAALATGTDPIANQACNTVSMAGTGAASSVNSNESGTCTKL